MSITDNPTIVLVHGAFADASGWAGVIRELRADGYDVVSPPNPLRGLASDAEVVREVVRAVPGPVVLAAHSYGGAVITQAAADLDNVTALVYFAAFGIDVGESAASVQGPFAPSLLSTTAVPTGYDAPGAVGGPDLYIAADRFRETFCADLPVDLAEVMARSQRPLSVAALTESATSAAWRSKPSWYQVATADNAISPDAQRFMAERMNATTETVDGSHVAFMAQPVRAAELIKRASAA